MSHPTFAFQHSILFIDDISKSENFIRTGLLAYPVHFEFCAGTLEDAIQAIEKSTHDILVVSLQFQDGLVLDFAQHVQKHFHQVSSIYMVEQNLLQLQSQVLKYGAMEVFPRPADASGLITHVESAVNSHRALQSRMRRSTTMAS